MKNQSFSNQRCFLLELIREGQDKGCLFRFSDVHSQRLLLNFHFHDIKDCFHFHIIKDYFNFQGQFYTFKKLAPVVCLSSKEKIRIKVAFETLSHKCRRDSHFQCNLFRSWRKWKRDNLRTKWSSWQRITIPLSNSSTAILIISPQTKSSVFSPG